LNKKLIIDRWNVQKNRDFIICNRISFRILNVESYLHIKF